MSETKSAFQRFMECGGFEEEDPVERLRFFCSLAMSAQDWIECEVFFTSVLDVAGRKHVAHDTCYLDQYSSRVCELGTRSCTRHHTVTPVTNEQREAIDAAIEFMDDYISRELSAGACGLDEERADVQTLRDMLATGK